VKIAVDAMGGDFAPQAIVEGAVQSALDFECRVILVGDRELIEPQLNRLSPPDGFVQIKHASEVVRMDEAPRRALAKKRDSSIIRTFELVKSGEANAAVSAGNSGAAMLAGMYVLELLPNVDRPCIGSVLPTGKGRQTVMADAGANVDCKPHNLIQFAYMANALARYSLEISNPKVGLLSIGEEAGKGNESVRTTFNLLKKSDLNFVGNIEGGDIFTGNVDVIVCDGFVGNVALKTGEGVVQILARALKDEIKSSALARFGYIFMRPALKKFKRRFDYDEFGGALLLGIDGIGLIAHGHSNPKAIKNAIKMADDFARSRIDRRIKEEVESSADLKPSVGDKVHQVLETLKDKRIEMDLKGAGERTSRVTSEE
jgi:glycerol-3-phosphate acyltransferase PlsX